MLSQETIHDSSKLRWACRRGMRELDIWLGSFLDKGYEALSDENKRDFVRLLACQDQELFDWLMGKTAPLDAAFPLLIEKIRAASKPLLTGS